MDICEFFRGGSGNISEGPANHQRDAFLVATAVIGEIRIITAGQIGHNLGSLISRVRRK